jgi:invasion protein IalB
MTAIVGTLATALARARLLPWLLAVALGATAAVAQTEPAPQKAQKAQKALKKTEKQKQQKQKQKQQPPQQPPQQAVQPQQPPVVYSQWTKICPKQPPGAQQMKQVCLTVSEARLETGQFLAGAALIEQQGEEKKLLRITLPLGMQIPPGTRLTLDSEQPASAVYVTCIPNGCMADYEINANYVDRMKKGQQLLLQGVNMPGQVANYMLPLASFARAVDGPPTDQDDFDRRQKEEWEKRLKQQQPPNAPPAAPPK